MTAFVIATVIIKDGEKLQEYMQKATKTVMAHGGEVLIRGLFDRAIIGEVAENNLAAVLRFPDLDALNAWYASDAYQALANLRNSAADMTFASYSVQE